MSVKVTQRHAQLIVESPYDPRFVAEAKKLGGRWSPEQRAWSVPLGERAQLRQLLLDCYRTDGGIPAEAAPAVTTRPATALPTAEECDRILSGLLLTPLAGPCAGPA